ncbi:hypothetical protein TRVA0_034S00958 [Trichomonascus vanleenenianus]|uniref:uncharacterized protein n=1 Tax=Trichomonascus vanleenenianus TaxID=2268995 RepID=UPI003EC9A767
MDKMTDETSKEKVAEPAKIEAKEVTESQEPKLDAKETDKPVEKKNEAKAPQKPTDASTSVGGTTQWTSYLKRAVANVESTLDKVLDTAENAGGESSSPSVSTSVKRTNSPAPGSPRMTMQERLAMAVGRQSPANPTSPTSSAKSVPSTDKKEPRGGETNGEEPIQKAENKESEPTQKAENNNESEPTQKVESKESEPQEKVKATIPPKTDDLPVECPSLDLTLTLANNIFEVVKLLDIPEDQKEVVNNSFGELVKNIETQNKISHDFQLQELEKIDSLETKVKYLVQVELDRTKEGKKGKSGLEKKIAEKDEQIALLFEEGQMMAKRELKQMTAIKRLRAQDIEAKKQSENALRKVTGLEKELSELNTKVKNQSDTIKNLSKSGSEAGNIRKERDSLKAANSKLTAELTELKQKFDSDVLEAQTTALSEATEKVSGLQKDKADLESQLSDLKRNSQEEIGQLKKQLQDAFSYSQLKQTELRTEIKNLETRVEHYRSKSEEAASGATGNDNHAHLLRQIEMLQSQHSIAVENWNGIEANLLDRITILEREGEEYRAQEAAARKRIRSINENYRNATDEIDTLTTRVQELESTNSALQAKLKDQDAEFADLKEELSYKQSELERDIKALGSEKANLEKKIAELESEVEKSQQQQEQHEHSFPEQEYSFSSKQHSSSSNMLDPLEATRHSSPYSPIVSSLNTPAQSQARSVSSFLSPVPVSGEDFGELKRGSIEVDDSASVEDGYMEDQHLHRNGDGSTQLTLGNSSGGPSIHLVGKLNATVRRLESELVSVQEDLGRERKQKDEACAQIVELMKEMDESGNYKTRVQELEGQLEAMKEREQTTLEMLGEKSEQVEELRADVDDIKAMYKQQIEDLIDRLSKAGQL